MGKQIFYTPGNRRDSWLEVSDDGKIHSITETDGAYYLRHGNLDTVISLDVALAWYPQHREDISRAVGARQ